MGVPKFFRWAAERYPTIITPFKDSPPPIDNLYLDMNGIIHNCTHPNDVDASRKAPTEKEMVQAMYAYLEKLFSVIQPRKNFLMAVDGVAPRAKMNQQRQRRYRAGYDMMVAREEALKMGQDIPDEGDVFDSNCITPGTDFMVRMSEHFQYFVTMKQHSDAAWQNCNVIYSGHDHPGEGEHKIIDFVRRRKMQPDYDPNETHCMYGLDADLVMLALATHEPHFMLLREVVSFNQGSKKERERKQEDAAKGIKEDGSFAKQDEFVLLHINIFREYLELDLLSGIEGPPPAHYNFERVVDDFVFMCFFIGNDFLPSLPTVGINDGGMTTMLNIYRDEVLMRETYLVRDAKPNWNAVEIFLNKLGELELETIRARQEEEAEYQKRAARSNPDHEVKTSIIPVTSIVEYKQRFYKEKHRMEEGWQPRSEEMQDLRQHYIEGLLWVMDYYYQGPPSWKWYYPHHYAPLASDMVGLSAIASRVRFEKGQPFLPHQQLLAVLPPMSHRLLPPAYGPLLRSSSSPLKQFFPAHLEIDRDGARAPWEGIVLIPFIEEKVLILAFDSVQSKVTDEQKKHNRLGIPVVFRSNHQMTPYDVPSAMFHPLRDVRVERVPYNFPDMPDGKKFVPELCKDVRMGLNTLEGFPSLTPKLPLTTVKKEMSAVNIFGMNSRKESLLLRYKDETDADSVDNVMHLVGSEVYVGYPHLKRAKVTGISDRRRSINARFSENGTFQGVEAKDLTAEQIYAFRKEAETHSQFLKAKCGIVIPEIDILVYAQRHVGMRITRKGRVVPQYSKKETCYPIQLICRKDELDLQPDPRNEERDRDLADYSIGSKMIFTGSAPKNTPAGYSVTGSIGFVMESHENEREGDTMFKIALRVMTKPQNIPESLVRYATSASWKSLAAVADSIGVSAMAVSQICSSIMTSSLYGSREIGLCMKFTGKNLARVGYAKMVQTSYNPWYVGAPNIFEKMEEDDMATGHHLAGVKGDFVGRSSVNRSGKGNWYFSEAGAQLVAEYCKAFKPLVKRIEAGGAHCSSLEPQEFLLDEWQDRKAEDVLDEIEAWIEETGIQKVSMIPATEDSFAKDHLRELETLLEENGARPTKELVLQNVVKRNLHFPTMKSPEGYVIPVPLPKDQKYQIGSRVVYCRTVGNVPFGAHGTITRMLSTGQSAEVVFDEPFTGGSLLGGRISTTRGAVVKLAALFVSSQIAEGEPLQANTPGTMMDNPQRSWVPVAIDVPTPGNQPAHADPAKAAGFQIPKPKSLKEQEATGAAVNVRSTGSGGVDLGALSNKLGNRTPSQPTPAEGNTEFPASANNSSIPKPRSKAAKQAAAAQSPASTQSPPSVTANVPRNNNIPAPAPAGVVPPSLATDALQSAFLQMVRGKLDKKLKGK